MKNKYFVSVKHIIEHKNKGVKVYSWNDTYDIENKLNKKEKDEKETKTSS